MTGPIQSPISHGSSGTIVEIECHLSNNLPTIIIVGMASKAVNEAKDRIRGAFASSHIRLPRKRITINLAPADIPKADSSFDLAMAVSILARGGLTQEVPLSNQAFVGELSLDGRLRPVRGIIGKLLAGRARGIDTFYIPAANLQQAQLVPGIRLIALNSLAELLAYFNKLITLPLVETGRGQYATPATVAKFSLSLSEIAGQSKAKRALEIAAAGGHNVLFMGPPGSGKSMLAKALPSILPLLSREESLEVTHLHSLASPDYERIISQPPFRSPHHTASQAAIIGGGNNLRPGEISLAHRGVLLLDELPEFSRETLEALRQPLEDRRISLARAKDTAEYPASFILVATANPCPCGYYGYINKACDCQPHQINNYQRRLSGPIMDRIDLQSNVHEIDHERLLLQAPDRYQDRLLQQRIAKARRLQAKRFGTAQLNAEMNNRQLKRFGRLEITAKQWFDETAASLGISARAYMRCIKVARTIADLEGSATVSLNHISEAFQYRAA